jgi:hypothetical protein
VNVFENFLAKYPKLFALLMLTLGIANAYLAYIHRSSPLRALFDGFFAILGFVLFFSLIFFARRIKNRH